MRQARKCEECGSEAYSDICAECCPHDDIDADEGYHCLGCGSDQHENVMSAMYDQAKDFAKYGE